MKKLLTLLLTAFTLSVSAQVEQDRLIIGAGKSFPSITKDTTYSSYSATGFMVTGRDFNKEYLRVILKRKPTTFFGGWDTIIINVNKNKLRWLNDSTAVYTK